MTEDADIAIRIERTGGKIRVLHSETSEEAPVSWRAWHLQRTRWMKGWLQTWLVHMRHPVRLYRDIGFGSFVTFQILILGQVLSTLIYPLGIGLVILDLVGLIPLFADRDFNDDLLLSFQLLALLLGWLGTVAAMISTMGKGGRIVRGWDLVTVPFYWFLLFGAAVSAVIELVVDPHRWNKTRHGVAQRSTEPKPSRFPPRASGEGMPAALPPPLPRPSSALHRPIVPTLLPET